MLTQTAIKHLFVNSIRIKIKKIFCNATYYILPKYISGLKTYVEIKYHSLDNIYGYIFFYFACSSSLTMVTKSSFWFNVYVVNPIIKRAYLAAFKKN